jgi:hypothetical protein
MAVPNLADNFEAFSLKQIGFTPASLFIVYSVTNFQQQ